MAPKKAGRLITGKYAELLWVSGGTIFVDIFNKRGLQHPMATVNFSVPDEVKQEFNKVFAGENKSAVLTQLMRQAIEERHRRRRRAAAIDALLELRGQQAPVSDEEIQRALEKERP